MHSTKTKGDIAVAKAIAELTEHGWNVGILITEHAKYDLLAEKTGRVLRVQVRSAIIKFGAVRVQLRNSWADRNGSHIRCRQVGDYDLLIAYCHENKKCYFIRDEDFDNSSEISLRVETCKNNQRAKILLAEDFESLKDE